MPERFEVVPTSVVIRDRFISTAKRRRDKKRELSHLLWPVIAGLKPVEEEGDWKVYILPDDISRLFISKVPLPGHNSEATVESKQVTVIVRGRSFARFVLRPLLFAEGAAVDVNE